MVGAVDERKGVVSEFGKFEGMGKAVVHGPDVSECSAGVADGEGGAMIPSEEEQACVAFLRVGLFFGLCVDVDKYAVGVRLEVIAYLYRLVRVDVVVPGHTQLPKGFAAPVPIVHGENQPAPIAESRVVHHVAYAACAGKRLPGFCREEEREGVVNKLDHGIIVVQPSLPLMVREIVRCEHVGKLHAGHGLVVGLVESRVTRSHGVPYMEAVVCAEG